MNQPKRRKKAGVLAGQLGLLVLLLGLCELLVLTGTISSLYLLRITAAAGLVGALFGEMLASKDGLGNILVQATSLYNTAQAFAIVVLSR
ncbi:hypothetical protein [Paenibacillus lemnae]|uniref:hypothetical protein n=1 Tax=Paenibacillus lemnae TaxID=1330551 RepID=UPI001FE64FC7|nr:hypothetical protein [Paenibacillus lemnae]